MMNYNIGDLVWVPDGTVNYALEGRDVNRMHPIEGPVYGVIAETVYPSYDNWLLVHITTQIRRLISKKDLRKIGV